MEGEAHWLTLVFIFGGALALFVLMGVVSTNSVQRRRNRLIRESQRFVCPQTREVVDATIVRFADHGKWIGVEKCSALTDPAIYRSCRGECVKIANSPSLSVLELQME